MNDLTKNMTLDELMKRIGMRKICFFVNGNFYQAKRSERHRQLAERIIRDLDLGKKFRESSYSYEPDFLVFCCDAVKIGNTCPIPNINKNIMQISSGAYVPYFVMFLKKLGWIVEVQDPYNGKCSDEENVSDVVRKFHS